MMGVTILKAILGAVCVVAAVLTVTWPVRADGVCDAALDGQWDRQNDTCTTTIVSQRQAVMTLTVDLPQGLIGHPTLGPPLLDYLRDRTQSWRAAGHSMVRASDIAIVHRTYTHKTVKSVVFHEFQQTVGNPANNTFRSFTFDTAAGKQLTLADLFKPGVNPHTALPPLARPFLAEALEQAQPPHEAGTYPFTTDRFEPQTRTSNYSGDYRAFALTPNELILFMPDRPMSHEDPWPQDRLVWSMDGGTIQTHIPLTALSTILRQDLTV
ncbi:conserved secreted protein [Mycobacteroides abscessus subsp. abscessus]|uniref:RsiV family protein n=1 Tax=Mycobacteroides abscessus TaxID=36809 RepID=UPI0009296109|nr:RsiV family protein [Mycobacteroides abscessus]SHU20790.1 conserved secreted protein [Mycobacteroides abscessus subsp. abscessus]SHX41425.1 conserved secreted protein [Mycobacteroides abscessus subsp. abscessus]SIG57161.1 conserved secreted protein [Mycobacteroides abscessus subsp. abscessus]SKD16129.1 conserved secreted protein [Mycobacteroides abscessus subsp. abscessus]SKK08636.1 conserved secreted protein [Mycobacteroides abscessus subsp. bolletii]